MKTTITTLVLLTLALNCSAPVLKGVFIFREEPIYRYELSDPLARAIVKLESNFQPRIVNPHSGARGLFQITPPCIKEANKICKLQNKSRHFTWNDAFDPYKSKEIWYIVQGFHNPSYDIKTACKLWFGSGVQYDGMTWKDYYKRIKNIMQ